MQSSRRKACDYCVSRKIKCDGQKPRCSNCTLYAVSCQTTVTRRASARDRRLTQTPSTVSQPDRVAVLEERLATIEALLAVFTGQTSVPEPQPHPSAWNHFDHSSSSSDRTTSEAHMPLDVSTFESAAIIDPLPQNVKAQTSDQLELAPLSEILPVVDNYFRNYNAIIPLFDETAFMRMLLDWFAGSTRRTMISWAAINTVLAISYRIVEGRSMDDPAFAQCTQNVRSVMSDLMMQGKDLMGLQVLLGMIILFQGSPDFQLAIVLTASVVRLTQSLGLHLKQAQAGFSRAEQAHRRRLFWLSYIYDKELAQRSQSPYLQLDSETDMDLPEPEDDLGVISSSTDNIRFNYLRTIAKFAFIQGKAHDLLYSHKSQNLTQEQKTNTIVRIEDMLEEWTREIPIELHTAEGIEKRLPPISRDLMMSLWFHHAECRVKIRSIFTFEDAWITRVRRYLFPTLIDVSDDIVGKVRRGDLPPLPPKWSQCVEYSRICMELLIARQPSEYIIWLHTCSSYSCLILLIINMIEFPDHTLVLQDSELLDGCFSTLGDIGSNLPFEPYKTLLSISQQLYQRAKGQVSRMMAKGDVIDEMGDFQMSPSMAWAILDDMDFQ